MKSKICVLTLLAITLTATPLTTYATKGVTSIEQDATTLNTIQPHQPQFPSHRRVLIILPSPEDILMDNITEGITEAGEYIIRRACICILVGTGVTAFSIAALLAAYCIR